MPRRSLHAFRALLFVASAALSACADDPARTLRPTAPQRDAVKFWENLASTRWNERAITLLASRPLANGSAASSRILTYLSLGQYRAALAAENGKQGSMHPSVAAAVGAASATVLKSFFPLDGAAIDQQLATDLTGPEWPGAKNQDVAAGEAIGRKIGSATLAQAAADNYSVVPVGVPPVGPGYWVSSGSAIVRSLHGTRPFFLSSPNQFRAPPPPAFGSSEFLAALAEVRAISDARTPEQLAIANFWNNGFTASQLNHLANEMIVEHHRNDLDAARILAYANAAAFDAQIACWDSKLTYWFIRPPQADPHIKTVFAMPNHPSYPSAHSCITGAFVPVLFDAFPSERLRLEATIEEAGMSRVYAGIHYLFDVAAGQAIGRSAAALALAGTLE